MSDATRVDAENDRIDAELAAIRRHRSSLMRCVIAIPVTFALALLAPFQILRIALLLALVGAWLAAAYHAIEAQTAGCPRCRKSMFMKGLWMGGASDACLHCGLRLDPSKDAYYWWTRRDREDPP